MNGDLSLSKSLGGLRIANRTDDDVRSNESSPAARPTTTGAPIRQAFNPQQAHPSSLPAIDASGAYDVTSALGFDPTAYAFDRLPSPLVSPTTSRPKSPTDPTLVRRRVSQRTTQTKQDRSVAPTNYPNGQPPPPGWRTQAAGFASAAMASNPGSYHEQSYPRNRAEPTQSANHGELRRSHSRATAASAAAAAMQGASTLRAPSGRSHQMAPSQSAPQPGPITAHPYLPPRRSSRPSPPTPIDNYNLTRAASQPSNLSTPSDTPVNTSEEWQERGAAVGEQRSLDSEGRSVTKTVKKGVKDFTFGRTLGEGSYSTVLAATDRQSEREYAVKVLDKRHIIKEKKVKYVNIEKDTLNRLTDHPGIVRLYYTFQDERSLYFVLDLATGGELLGVLKKTSTFDEDCSRFYGAQILDSVEYMHSRGIIHRDLKPENVLLDEAGHVKITDFGTAKILDIGGQQQPSGFGQVSVSNDPMDGADSDRAVSFVGTAEYVSPELLRDKNACKASDLWAFGCIVYQLLAGRPPFKASNEYQTFQKIVGLEYTFPEAFPSAARDLVQKLLVLNPADRLPIGGIKRHRFFEGIRWGKGLWSQKPPKLRPLNPYRSEPTPSRSHQTESVPPAIPRQPPKPSAPSSAPSTSAGSRPPPRIITELAPPSQLDIDWSSVLNRPNERILKLGNLVVYSMPAPHSPGTKHGSSGDPSAETPSKFSRLFGASATKKRQRLVMVSSAARIILAPSGGDKKEAKLVIDLRDREVTCKSQQDAKGYTVWNVATVSSPSAGLCYTWEPTNCSSARSPSHLRRC